MGLFNNIIEWIRSWFDHPTPPTPPPPPPPPVPVPPPQPQPSPVDAIKQELLQRHNDIRNSRGVPPLNPNDALARAAQKHTDWEVSRHNLSHNEPGRPVEERVSEEGYRWTWVGENIAEGQTSAQDVMDAWMNSSGHRANILNGHFKDVGFGVDQDNDGTWWWTADFGSQE